MTKFYTIYKIINKVNYKTYIGKHITENLLDGYMGSGISLKEDKKKYGIKNFKKEILFCFDNELDINKKEVELILKYNSNNPKIGYNQWPKFKIEL